LLIWNVRFPGCRWQATTVAKDDPTVSLVLRKEAQDLQKLAGRRKISMQPCPTPTSITSVRLLTLSSISCHLSGATQTVGIAARRSRCGAIQRPVLSLLLNRLFTRNYTWEGTNDASLDPLEAPMLRPPGDRLFYGISIRRQHRLGQFSPGRQYGFGRRHGRGSASHGRSG
jgi:hypothetical protein